MVKHDEFVKYLSVNVDTFWLSLKQISGFLTEQDFDAVLNYSFSLLHNSFRSLDYKTSQSNTTVIHTDKKYNLCKWQEPQFDVYIFTVWK